MPRYRWFRFSAWSEKIVKKFKEKFCLVLLGRKDGGPKFYAREIQLRKPTATVIFILPGIKITLININRSSLSLRSEIYGVCLAEDKIFYLGTIQILLLQE